MALEKTDYSYTVHEAMVNEIYIIESAKHYIIAKVGTCQGGGVGIHVPFIFKSYIFILLFHFPLTISIFKKISLVHPTELIQIISLVLLK